MSMSERLRATPARTPGPRCSLELTLERMGEVDRLDLVAALADRLITSTTISLALQAEGFPVGTSAVARHRRGDCRCLPTG
jgi:hypothetical protein